MNKPLIQLECFLCSLLRYNIFLVPALEVDTSHFDVVRLFSRCEIGKYQHQRKKILLILRCAT